MHEFEELSGRILGAAVEVHKQLGPGFIESVYQKAVEVALRHREIPFERQRPVNILFEGEQVGTHLLDLLVGGAVVVELKAVKHFEDIHYAQVRSYLRATNLRVGLLLNFSAPILAIKRIMN